jgi:hypothetical protein
VTGYGLVKKKKTVAVVGGVGTAYAYSRYRKDKKKENAAAENRRARWYKQRYDVTGAPTTNQAFNPVFKKPLASREAFCVCKTESFVDESVSAEPPRTFVPQVLPLLGKEGKVRRLTSLS